MRQKEIHYVDGRMEAYITPSPSGEHWSLEESKDKVLLFSNKTKGKITDAGYDLAVCYYTKIPKGYDIIFTAEIEARSFFFDQKPTFQEGFGIFLRDTMEKDAETGCYYSNMIAAGGFYGRYNFFGRTGITADSKEQVTNYALFDKAEENEVIRITPDDPKRLQITLIKKGNRFSAKIIDPSGADLLQTDGKDMVFIDLPQNALFEKEPEVCYLGFLAARGAKFVIDKKTVQVCLEKEQCPEKEPAVRQPAKNEKLKQPVPEWQSDLQKMIHACACGETVRIPAGVYYPDSNIVISENDSGTQNGRKKLAAEGEVTFDFGMTSNRFLLDADYWDIEGIRVTGGGGFQIRGSSNHLDRCIAFRNLDTGIQISGDIEDDTEQWPDNNLIENCLSYENRDLSGQKADGFACKIAAGEGNRFLRCSAWLNTDDGFDLFSKNRKIGAVVLQECRSCFNGYMTDGEDLFTETEGNGIGFKLGGSGLEVRHRAEHCIAIGNKRNGFSSNSNPFLFLSECSAYNNKKKNLNYYYTGTASADGLNLTDCDFNTIPEYDEPAKKREIINGLKEMNYEKQ